MISELPDFSKKTSLYISLWSIPLVFVSTFFVTHDHYLSLGLSALMAFLILGVIYFYFSLLNKSSELKNTRILAEANREIISNFDPHLYRFFEVLEKHGVKKVDEVLSVLASLQGTAWIIFESGERTPPAKNLAGLGSRTFFADFFETLKTNGAYPLLEIHRIKLTASCTFLLLSDKPLNPSTIKSDYYSYVKKQCALARQKLDSSSYSYRTIQKHKSEMSSWYSSFETKKPWILCTPIYDYSEIRRFLEGNTKYEKKIASLLSQELKLLTIKFVYLFEAVGFDTGTLNRLDKVESQLVSALLSDYNLVGSQLAFVSLMSKHDILTKFENALKTIDGELFSNLQNDAKYESFKRLIHNFRSNIVGAELK